jgi:hypothetical protein
MWLYSEGYLECGFYVVLPERILTIMFYVFFLSGRNPGMGFYVVLSGIILKMGFCVVLSGMIPGMGILRGFVRKDTGNEV